MNESWFKRHRLHDRHQSRHKRYVTVFYPEHPTSWSSSGNIYYHRLVMENHLGRYLESEEHIHHRDENLLNNDIGNLKLVCSVTHGKEHLKLELVVCGCCQEEFRPKKSTEKYCSPRCAQLNRRRVKRPSKAELQSLVWQHPTSHLSQMFGVSDVAIAKWCRKMGVDKPPRGYWQKRNGR